MTSLKKYDLTGRETGQVAIEMGLLEASANQQMIKDYIVALRANARQWSANTKTRAEVNHSGKKPHAQKGTGMARQGYLGAPHYRGGGRVFSPRPKFDQHVRINRKEKRNAIHFLLSEKIKENHVRILESAPLDKPQTKSVAQFLDTLHINGKRVLFLVEGLSGSQIKDRYENLFKSIRNIPRVNCVAAANVSGYDLLLCQEIVILNEALSGMMAALKKASNS